MTDEQAIALTTQLERIADVLEMLAMDREDLRQMIDNGGADNVPIVVLTAYGERP